MNWFIYSLIDPRDHRVRYVGKTNDVKHRLSSHIHEALHSKQHTHKVNWIRSLVDAGQLPALAIIESGEGDWKAAEKHWIAFYRMAGCALVNATDGGDGVEGFHPSAETRAKRSAAMKGRIFSDEHRAKISVACKLAKASPEARARQSAINKARWQSPEYRAKLSASSKVRWQSPENRARQSAAVKAARARNNEVL